MILNRTMVSGSLVVSNSLDSLPLSWSEATVVASASVATTEVILSRKKEGEGEEITLS